jgi:TQXA domain-containing protein/LPXTG-motif cell wall-anchored protein
MTIAQRAATRRRAAAAVVASLAVAAGLVGTLAGPASAEDPGSTATFVDHSEVTWDVKGDFHDGVGPHIVFKTGLQMLTVDGADEFTFAYCIDAFQGISAGDVLDGTAWAEAGIANSDKVAKILANYFPTGDGPEGYELTGRDNEKAAATQAAIWHFANGFDLLPYTDTATVEANYATILKAIEDGVLPSPGGKVTLDIEGPSDTEALPNELVGPFVVHTTATSVELTPGPGLTVHNEDGTPFEGPAHDGDELWLTSDAPGTVSLSAKASGLESEAKAYTSPERQDMAFAVVTPNEVEVQIGLEFTTPTTPTSETPPTTPEVTTPAPTTPTPAVVETTPTTVPTTQPTGGHLPKTGAQSLLLVALALVLLAIGATFGIVSRRRRREA